MVGIERRKIEKDLRYEKTWDIEYDKKLEINQLIEHLVLCKAKGATHVYLNISCYDYGSVEEICIEAYEVTLESEEEFRIREEEFRRREEQRIITQKQMERDLEIETYRKLREKYKDLDI